MNSYLRFVLCGVQVGGIFGFSFGILYWLAIGLYILIVLIEPSPSSSSGVMSVIYVSLIFIYAIMFTTPGVIVGGLTGALFGLLFKKLGEHKTTYFIVCELFCILFALVINAFLWNPSSFFSFKSDDVSAQQLHSMVLWEVAVTTIVPSVIYIIVGFFANIYLFNEFEIIELERQVALEDAISTSA